MEQNARRLAATWQELPPVRKGLLAGTGFALAALLFLLYSWSSSSSFVTLYSGLDATDSSEIVGQLRSRGVDFRLEAGGATIRVPESEINELRIEFASQGLPQGGHVVFEIFEGNAFTATDFVQRLNFQRGLQGELARTIETFPAADGARVHVVLPERTLFREDDEPATASVVLQMRAGRGLTTDEVSGVAHLVAGAVAGLDKEQVTMLDESGNILFNGAAAEEGGIAFTSTQQALVREYEAALIRDAQSLLDRSIGATNSVVTVRATMDFDQVETQTSTFADEDVALSETNVTETYSTTGEATVGAIPGAVTNVPGANADLPGGEAGQGTTGSTPSTTDYERTENTTNYEVPQTLTTSIEAPGDVERLSVSLILDEAVTAEQATARQDIVAAAVGLDTERGDSIVMTRLLFDRTTVNAAAVSFEAVASTETIMTYARIALPIIVLLVAFFFFRMLMRSISRRSYQVAELPLEYAALPGGMPAALPAGAAAVTLEEAPTPEEMKSDLERQVTKLAESHPDTVAEVVQSWLRED